ncbi:MAG: aminotransferase class IV family protein [Candidatus Omnitrophica bacterium]|nr:aminotransferase class IV family protein [Candidatus Omnitrophota bacterium]
MSRKFLWLDGKLVEAKHSFLESFTPGVLKAKGVFETMRVSNGKVALLEAHLRRMSRGLKVLGIRRSMAYRTIPANIRQLLRVVSLTEARVRVMLWQKGACVHCAIVAEAFAPPSARRYKEGFKAILTNGHRRQTPVPIKSLDYAIFREGLEKARAAGFDEALFVNRKNELVEGSRTNIFLVKDNFLFTPPVESGCLPGVMRQTVLEDARRLKIHCAAQTLRARDLVDADEAFLTNALLGIMPLTGLDKQPIGTGKPWPVTRRLCLGLPNSSSAGRIVTKGYTPSAWRNEFAGIDIMFHL